MKNSNLNLKKKMLIKIKSDMFNERNAKNKIQKKLFFNGDICKIRSNKTSIALYGEK